MKYKFKHLENHHIKELNQMSYRLSKHEMTLQRFMEWLDEIIDVYASQSEPNTVTEPFHKEAIELVKKFIPNNALAKEYILELLNQKK